MMQPATRNDWLDRIYAASPLPAWALGAAIALGLIVFFVGLAALTGELRAFLERGADFNDRNVRLGTSLAVLVGYLPTAQHWLRSATRRELGALGVAPSAAAGSAAGLRRAGLVALLLAPLTGLLVDRDPSLYLRAGYWDVGALWTWTTGCLVAWSLGRLAYETLASARSLSYAAAGLERVDLLDRSWLAPFGRQGMLCTLLWLVIPAVFAVHLGDASFLSVLTVLCLGCGGIGGGALLLATAGVRQRLRDARDAELRRVHRALAGDVAALAESPVAGRAATASLADLLAYERRIRGVPTWPFDTASWLRVALLLALPVGSWLGGAIVERLLALLLD
jgi:hypothetical protein